MSEPGEIVYIESHEQLEKILATTKKVVVVFSARDWCIPCQRLVPHVDAAASILEDYTFVDVDIDHVEGVKEEFDIMSVPQIWYYEDVHEGLPGRKIHPGRALQIVAELQK